MDFTADQNQLLDELLMRWPTGAGYRKGGIPQSVEAIAAPLIELGCVEHVEFTHDDQEGECLRLSPGHVRAVSPRRRRQGGGQLMAAFNWCTRCPRSGPHRG
jgi:hypothetical protein